MSRYFRLTSRCHPAGSVLQGHNVETHLYVEANKPLAGLKGLFVCAKADDLVEWHELLDKAYVCVVEFPEGTPTHVVDVFDSGLHQSFVEGDATVTACIDAREWLQVARG